MAATIDLLIRGFEMIVTSHNLKILIITLSRNLHPNFVFYGTD